LPALRDQPFAVGVNLDDKQLADWPRQEDGGLYACGRDILNSCSGPMLK
jgi:hypothetical protein